MDAFKQQLRQTCTYWAPGTFDDYGTASYAAPVPLACRWEDGVEMIRTRDGREIQSTAIVDVASNVQEDGFLAEGTLTDASPHDVAGARQILRVDRIPSLRAIASETEYTAYL